MLFVLSKPSLCILFYFFGDVKPCVVQKLEYQIMGVVGMRGVKLKLVILLILAILREAKVSWRSASLSRISIHKVVFALHDLSYVKASPNVLAFSVFRLLYICLFCFCLTNIFMF